MSSRGKGDEPLGDEGPDDMKPEKDEGIITKAVDAVTGAVDAVIEHAATLISSEKPPPPPPPEEDQTPASATPVPEEVPPEKDGFVIFVTIEDVDVDDEDEDDAAPLPASAPRPPFDGRHPRHFPIDGAAALAHERLAAIMTERKANWFKAFGRNLWRRRKDHVRWIYSGAVGIAAGGAVLVITQDPFAAVGAGTAAAATVPPATDLLRIRREQRRKGYPDTPEFHDDWSVASYEFVRILRGYNLRMTAIERLRQFAGRLDDEAKRKQALETAARYLHLLSAYWDEFIYVSKVLQQYAPPSTLMGEIPPADEDSNAAIRLIDPLKDGRYDWLMLDPEVIPMGKERDQLEADIVAIRSHRTSEEAADPYLGLQRQQERQAAKKAGRPHPADEDDEDDD